MHLLRSVEAMDFVQKEYGSSSKIDDQKHQASSGDIPLSKQKRILRLLENCPDFIYAHNSRTQLLEHGPSLLRK